MNIPNDKTITLFGASPDTGNQGVTALCYSVLDGLAQRNLEPLTVFDHGRGRRAGRVTLDRRRIQFERLGAVNGRRYYKPENLWRMRVAARAGGLWNDSARAVCHSRAVLDVSGGDSFTELYGADRFRTVTLPKRIALEAGRRLILLPQTYGPFSTAAATSTARDIVRRAEFAWARDTESFDQLRALLGGAYDPARHHSGVDMAFGLPASAPARVPAGEWAGWLAEHPRTQPIIGFNVSGLLYNDPDAAASRFGLRADYRTAVLAALRTLLASTDARIILVPHVVVGRRDSECDLAACASVEAALGSCGGRVSLLDGSLDAAELKWVIGRTDWFCGTRMHATIAGLSSGVPTVALAYSMKTQGVFETCGQGEEVVDLRACDSVEINERIVNGWRRRDGTRRALADAIPAIRDRAESQMDAIAAAVGRSNGAAARGLK